MIEETGGSWDRRPGETAKAYAAFGCYLRLGPMRSLSKAYQLFLQEQANTTEGQGEGESGGEAGARKKRGAPSRWEEWSSANEWVSRAAEYDAHLARMALKERERDHLNQLEAHRNRAAKVGQILTGLGLELAGTARTTLKQVEDIKAGRAIVKKGQRGPSLRDVATLARAAAYAANHGLMGEAQALGVEDLLVHLEGAEV